MNARYKCCAVPMCKSTSNSTPQKLFINVPKSAHIRRTWLKLARRDPASLTPTSTSHFCEDHFDVEKDTANYMQYKMGFSQKILLADGVVPSKFDCQQDRKRRLGGSGARALVSKRERKKLVQRSIEESCIPKTNTQTDVHHICDMKVGLSFDHSENEMGRSCFLCYGKKLKDNSFHRKKKKLSSTVTSVEINTDDRIDFEFVDATSAADDSSAICSVKMEFEEEPVTIKTEEADFTDMNSLSEASYIDPAHNYYLANDAVVKLEEAKVEIDEFPITSDLTKIKEEIGDS